MGKLEPVKKILDVKGMSLAQWNEGREVDIYIKSSEKEWIANLFRFTDYEGNTHSVLFVENVPPEDL